MDAQRLKTLIKALILSKMKDKISGGLAEGKSPSEFNQDQLESGKQVEMEHTNDPSVAEEIAMDHLTEDPQYYEKLKELELSELEKGNLDQWKNKGYVFERYDGNLEHYVIQAFKNGKRAGHISYRKQPYNSPAYPEHGYHPVGTGHIDEKHRGKGLYQELIRQASDHAKSLGSKGVVSMAYQRNPIATKEWEKLNPRKEPSADYAPGEEKEDLFLNEDLNKAPVVFDSEVHGEPYKEVVRLENEIGKGPYRAPGMMGGARWWDSPHSLDPKHPNLREDMGFTGQDKQDFWNKDYNFAFENEDQMKRWFSPTEMEKLSRLGFKPKKVKARKIWSSGKQVFYQPYIEPKWRPHLEDEDLEKQDDGVTINPEHGKIIADAYENMKHEPNHPEVKSAYDSLVDETVKQFHDIMKGGLRISKMRPNQENPYKTSKDMHDDIKNNNHLWYYPTESGFGSGDESFKDHPMLKPTGIIHDGHNLLANDVFRIVHDINGHHIGGESGFGPKGEHRAYLQHKKMYSPLAQKALATETMGQNNTVNWGKHGEHNRTNPLQTIYADQKAGLLPDHIINGNWHTATFGKSEELQKAKPVLAPPSDFSDEDENVQDSKILTHRGKEVAPNPDIKFNTKSFLDKQSGILHTPKGSFKLNMPSLKDQEYQKILNSSDIQDIHTNAMNNWFKLNNIHKSGQQLPEDLIAHANIFSILSANTPVPQQELAYSRLVDTMNKLDIDPKSLHFTQAMSMGGEGREEWQTSDSPTEFPVHSREYWTGRAKPAIIQQAASKMTGRQPGDITALGTTDAFADRLMKYPNVHSYISNLVNTHKNNTRAIVSQMMADKSNPKLPKDHPMKMGVGLGSKTSRYAISMMGGGNAVIPDTHFVRHTFGMDANTDGNSIVYLKNTLWNPKNHNLLNDLDEYYHQKHPAVRFVENKYFGGKKDPDSIFPAFWLHWLSIAPHEKAMGIGKPFASKNLTDHTPFWDKAQEILDKHGLGKMRKNEQAPLPVRSAAAALELEHALGSAPASMVFYAHILPQLLNSNKIEELGKSEHPDPDFMHGKNWKLFRVPKSAVYDPNVFKPLPDSFLNRRGEVISNGHLSAMKSHVNYVNYMLDNEHIPDDVNDYYSDYLEKIITKIQDSADYHPYKDLDKSNYGPQGMGLYDHVINLSRKMGRTGEEIAVGPNRAVQYAGPTRNQQAEMQSRIDRKKSRKNPVKVYSKEERQDLASKRGMLAASELEKAPSIYDIDPQDENWYNANSVTHFMTSGGYGFDPKEARLKTSQRPDGSFYHRIITPHRTVHVISHDKKCKDPIAHMLVDHIDGQNPTVAESIVDTDYRGHGYGKALYLNALKHHGKLLSDDEVSPEANKLYQKLAAHPNVKAKLAPYDENNLIPHKLEFKKQEPLSKPYVSEAQRRWAHTEAGTKALGGKAAVAHWDKESKGKDLPERKTEELEKIVHQAHPSGKVSNVIFEQHDTHPNIPHTKKQKDLINGINLNHLKSLHSGWTRDVTLSGSGKNILNKKVIVKAEFPRYAIDVDLSDSYAEFNTAHREVLFHNLAHNFWGLGKHVPTTSLVHDPVLAEEKDRVEFEEGGDYEGHAPNHSVMEYVRGAKHYSSRNQEHNNIINKAGKDGTLHKLAIMDLVSGNTDRHNGNYMISKKGIHLIDHGFTFDYNTRDLYSPSYLQPSRYVDKFNQQKIHPDAKKWLNSLKEKDLEMHLKAHKVPSHIEKDMIKSLKIAKKVVKSKRNATTDDILLAIEKGVYGY